MHCTINRYTMYMYYALVDRAPEAYGSHLRVHVCLLVFDSALIILLRHMISLFFMIVVKGMHALYTYTKATSKHATVLGY